MFRHTGGVVPYSRTLIGSNEAPAVLAPGDTSLAFARYAVFRVKKSGGMVALVSVHDTREAAVSESENLTEGSPAFRFSVLPVTVSPSEENPNV